MSERKYFTVVTDKGQSKIAQAVAGGQKLNITTFVVGDANGQYYTPTSDMTAIKNEVWRGTISKMEILQDAQKLLRITTVIPAEVSGFVIREMGLLDETGELVAIGNSPDMPKVALQDGASIELKLVMRLAVKNTEALSFTIDPHTVIMTKDMLDTHDVDENAHHELFEGKADKTTMNTELGKKANSSHNHSASDINSGTLPIDRGGTGNTTGNAATATKLQTARTITLSGDITGSATFDGSANKTIATTLKNSGVAAGTYGADLKALAVATWISNNRGLHSTTATSTWTAKQDCTVSFRYTVSSESVSYDYLNITANGTQILANTGGTASTNTLSATLKTGQALVFNYRKDGSNNTNEDCAKISEVKVTPTGGSATNVTTAIFSSFFTATNGVYGFLPLIELQKKSVAGGSGTNGFTLPCVTVDAKGRVTSAIEVFIMPADGGGMTKSEIDNVMKGTGTGDNNVALGNNSLSQNTTGYQNTAIGVSALEKNKTGLRNVAIGVATLTSNTEGAYNTAIGNNALCMSTAGKDNVAIGIESLYYNTGDENTAVGNHTLELVEGYKNVAIGFYAMRSSGQGNLNTAIGYKALTNNTNYSNCTGLGANSSVTGSNQVQLGDSSVTVYAQKALVTRSDARDKIDIEDSPLGLNFIMKLRPVKYRMNSREAYFEEGKERDFTATNDGSKAGKRPHYGLIAQEVKQSMNELGVDFAGYLDSKVDGGEDVLSLGYTEFIAPMIKAIQQQQQMIEQLQKEIEKLKG